MAALARATRTLLRARPHAVARSFGTFQDSGLEAPTKRDDETFVRTPFIGDGYFQEEMGELFEFTVQPGDSVAADDTVAVVDTHKASVDIRTPVAGVVERLLVAPGDGVWEIHPIMTLTGASPPASPRVKMK
mmetsp:Transcript_21224/g.63348  ORF Transcript_21224/g.63348 Transcript_21224/m.63348 type:complete len:132 (-) Transcript_21224:35-430(-)